MNNFKFSLYKRLILKYCGYPKSILDIGCGKDKELSWYFPNSDYTGIDKIFGDDIENGLKIEKDYDLVIHSEIFEHLSFKRTIPFHKGKCSFIVIPNDYNLISRLKFLFGGTIDENAFTGKDKHLHFPTLVQSDNFIRNNFKIIHKTYFSDNFFLPDEFLTWLANLCPALFARGVIYICQNCLV